MGFGASDFRNLYLSKNLTKNHAILEEEARIPIIYNAKWFTLIEVLQHKLQPIEYAQKVRFQNRISISFFALDPIFINQNKISMISK